MIQTRDSSSSRAPQSGPMLVQLEAVTKIYRMGEVEAGTTVADFDEEEIRRRISLSLALVPVE